MLIDGSKMGISLFKVIMLCSAYSAVVLFVMRFF